MVNERKKQKTRSEVNKLKSRQKEHERNQEIKEAFGRLQGHLPFTSSNLSKIKTLRLAKLYIEHLSCVLRGEAPPTQSPMCTSVPLYSQPVDDFHSKVQSELETRNSYTARMWEEMYEYEPAMSFPAIHNEHSCT